MIAKYPTASVLGTTAEMVTGLGRWPLRPLGRVERRGGGAGKRRGEGGQVKCTLDKIMSDLKLGLGTKIAGLCAGLRAQALDQSGPFLFVCLITEAEEKDGGDFPRRSNWHTESD